MKEFFTPTSSRPVKVISKQEIELLEEIVKRDSFSVGVKAFRQICDASNIPFDFEKRIVKAFIQLAKSVNNDKDTESLNAAIFNLKIKSSH